MAIDACLQHLQIRSLMGGIYGKTFGESSSSRSSSATKTTMATAMATRMNTNHGDGCSKEDSRIAVANYSNNNNNNNNSDPLQHQVEIKPINPHAACTAIDTATATAAATTITATATSRKYVAHQRCSSFGETTTATRGQRQENNDVTNGGVGIGNVGIGDVGVGGVGVGDVVDVVDGGVIAGTGRFGVMRKGQGGVSGWGGRNDGLD